MELCSLNDAFGLMSEPNNGCKDNTGIVESRKHDRKKAKKCRGPPLNYINSEMSMANVGTPDPDRPAVKAMEPVPALNNATGLREHAPVDQDWGTTESFVGESNEGDIAKIMNVVQGVNKLQSSSKPSYFGASPNDSPGSPVPKSKSGKLEGFQDKAAPFVNTIGQDSAMLDHDFTAEAVKWQDKKRNLNNYNSRPTYGLLTPDLTDQESAALPPPEIAMNWRQGGLPGGQSQFFNRGLNNTADTSTNNNKPSKQDLIDKQEMLKRMDHILSRLDDMQYVNQENAQKEVLLFIMTGLGVLFVMDMACRAATRL